jgi:hypothetical protein
VPTACCTRAGTTFSLVGGGLVLLSASAPTMSQVCSSPWSTRSKGGISCDNTNSTVRA